MEKRDCLIIGGGPAGLTAAVYLQRYKIQNAIISRDVGGYVNEAHLIENYPGYSSIAGMQLMMKFKEHVDYLKGEIIQKDISAIRKENDNFIVTAGDDEYQAKAIILTTGTKRRSLNVPGEAALKGKGVSYCATCDGFFFKDKTVAVIGGNDSAASAAVLLSQFCKKVTIIYRKDKIRAEPYWIEQIEKNDTIEVVTNANVTRINGTDKVESVNLDTEETISVDGVFIEIGSVPSTEIMGGIDLETDGSGFVIVNPDQSTSVSGIYAAGDITTESNKFKQIITACAEGAIAAESVYNKLK